MSFILSWFLDLIFGDPYCLPHPVVYMGKWIAAWEKLLNKNRWRKSKGAVFAILSISLTFVVVWGVLRLADAFVGEWLTVLITVIGVFFCLAGKTLRKEVRMVFEACDRSVEDGRKQVARIVGRDTAQLSLQESRTAALETLAENLSDGVIAPLFWYALLGLPGMMAYKMINTLDSMIGYHSERYLRFGCWAARIDDAANYLPARITALLMLLAAGKPQLLGFVLRFGPQHASPNSGWPEAALAGILDCRFGGPHNYFGELFDKPFIGTTNRPLTTADMKKSLRVCLIAEIIAVASVFILLLKPLNL